MRRSVPLLALAFLTACDPPKAARALPDVSLPAPKPWSAPKTALPREFVEETAFLLAHGMGDPRGGEYGAAKVVLGSVWGGPAAPVELHGWILPGKPMRIVALNGLVYDVRAPGGAASLESDVQNLVGSAGPERAKTWMPLAGAEREGAVRTLLVAGRADLAERVHKAGLPEFPHGSFLTRWFDQAVVAHMLGDDVTALRVGRAILRERPAYEKRHLAQNGPRPTVSGGTTDVQLPFLDVLPDLVRDAERRLRAAPRAAFAPKGQPVEALIDHLDEVAARQNGQPGTVILAEDPVVAELIARGAPAVEPLLKAIETDGRLTRSVSFARDFAPGRNLVSVRDAAYSAFRGIVQTDEIPGNPSYGPPKVEALRAFWKETGGKLPAERWFDTLADDSAGWRRWEEAAQRLFDHAGTRRSRYAAWGTMAGPLNAETVRGRTNPSLSDLLEKRSRELLADESQKVLALRLARWLGRYDPPRSLAALRETTQAGVALVGTQAYNADIVYDSLVPALELRAKNGDATAWKDYATMLERVGRPPTGRYPYLRPLLEHPDVPELRAAAGLLTRPGSSLNVVEQVQREPYALGGFAIMVSPALEMPAVWEAVGAALSDRKNIGESWVDDRGNAWVSVNGKPSPTNMRLEGKGDARTPKAGLKRPYRTCDAVAAALSRLKGAPTFQPYWTSAQKDAAIPRLRAYLQANKGRIEDVLWPPNDWKGPAWMWE